MGSIWTQRIVAVIAVAMVMGGLLLAGCVAQRLQAIDQGERKEAAAAKAKAEETIAAERAEQETLKAGYEADLKAALAAVEAKYVPKIKASEARLVGIEGQTKATLERIADAAQAARERVESQRETLGAIVQSGETLLPLIPGWAAFSAAGGGGLIATLLGIFGIRSALKAKKSSDEASTAWRVAGEAGEDSNKYREAVRALAAAVNYAESAARQRVGLKLVEQADDRDLTTLGEIAKADELSDLRPVLAGGLMSAGGAAA